MCPVANGDLVSCQCNHRNQINGDLVSCHRNPNCVSYRTLKLQIPESPCGPISSRRGSRSTSTPTAPMPAFTGPLHRPLPRERSAQATR